MGMHADTVMIAESKSAVTCLLFIVSSLYLLFILNIKL